MQKQRIFWAIAFGSMLAMSGCGSSDSGGAGGTAGSGGAGGTAGSGGAGGSGGSGSSLCSTLCGACSSGVADCVSGCESELGQLPSGIDINSCPNELDALASCLGANSCDSNACNSELTAWSICIVGIPF